MPLPLEGLDVNPSKHKTFHRKLDFIIRAYYNFVYYMLGLPDYHNFPLFCKVLYFL